MFLVTFYKMGIISKLKITKIYKQKYYFLGRFKLTCITLAAYLRTKIT